jgi:hypothetical protein
MDQFVFGPERFKMGCDGLAQFRKSHGTEPAGLGMDHVFELVAAACQFEAASRIASSGNST